jgi:YD repeat-containing protein
VKKSIPLIVLFAFQAIKIYSQIAFYPPQFKGGYDAFRDYVSMYSNFPEGSKPGSSVLVQANIAIDKTGKIRQVITGGTEPAYNAEVKRVLKLMPNWSPAILYGLPRDTMAICYVRFSDGINVNLQTVGDTLQVIRYSIPLFNIDAKQNAESKTKQQQLQLALISYNEGVKLSQENKIEEALQKFTIAVNNGGNQLDYLYNRAAMYFKLGQKQNACKDWLEGARLNDADAAKLFDQNCKCLSPKMKNNLQASGYLRKVKQVKSLEFNASQVDGKIEKENRTGEISITKYNEDGNIYEGLTVDIKGHVLNKVTYNYDNNGYRTEANYYKEDTKLISNVIYKYDEAGRIIEKIDYTPGKEAHLTYLTDYKYDNNGNLIEVRAPMVTEKFKYDSLNQRTEFRRFFQHELSRTFFYKYDEKGREVESTEIDEKLVPIQTLKYKYNTDDLIIETLVYKGKANKFDCKQTYSYEYDKTGNIVKEISFEYGKYTMSIREIEYY